MIKYAAILSVCLVYTIQLALACEDGHWGWNCAYQCHCRDGMEICDKFNGKCKSGCAYGWTGGEGCGLGNVAYGKSADQSSTFATWTADKAIGGTLESDIWTGKCAHTGLENNPYLIIDLGVPHVVFNVSLLNRKQFGNRLQKVSVRVGNTKDPSFFDQNGQCDYFEGPIPDGGWHTFTCMDGTLVGRYVVVQLGYQGTYLTVCEASVNGYVYVSDGSCPEGKHGPNCQLDCHCWNEAESKNCNVRGGSCPAGCAAGWRGPACTEPCAFDDFGVNCQSRCHCKGDGVVCNPADGSFCNGDGQSCDFGWSGSGCQVGNVAYLRPCTQSSTWLTLTCDKGIDGNIDPQIFAYSCTHTNWDWQPWWQVDLGVVSGVYHVTFYNREGSFGRLRDFEVRVGNDQKNIDNNELCAVYAGTIPDAGVVDIPCNYGAVSGRYATVKIRNRFDYLTICEVAVYGFKYAKDCQEGTYGPMCSQLCGNCKFDTTCDKVTGRCPNGCREGYSGSDCLTQVTCPPLWNRIDGYQSGCYRYFTDKQRTQDEAMAYCIAFPDTHLVAVERQEELDSIGAWLSTRPEVTDSIMTTGYCYPGEGQARLCYWRDRSGSFFTIADSLNSWAPGEPRNNGPVVKLWKQANFMFDDVESSSMGFALCEMEF